MTDTAEDVGPLQVLPHRAALLVLVPALLATQRLAQLVPRRFKFRGDRRILVLVHERSYLPAFLGIHLHHPVGHRLPLVQEPVQLRVQAAHPHPVAARVAALPVNIPPRVGQLAKKPGPPLQDVGHDILEPLQVVRVPDALGRSVPYHVHLPVFGSDPYPTRFGSQKQPEFVVVNSRPTSLKPTPRSSLRPVINYQP